MATGGMMDRASPEEFFRGEDARVEDGPKPNGHAEDFEGVRFQFTPFAQIKVDTAPPYIIRELVPRVGVVLIWGGHKSGKTFSTFDMEMHIGLNWPYRGRRVEG